MTTPLAEWFRLGGWVMWPLAVCACMMLAAVTERFVAVASPRWRTDAQYRTMHRRIFGFFNELAPSLGLLGTVLGVVECFMLVGRNAGTDRIMAGLGVATITTVYGLFISLVTMVAGFVLDHLGRPEDPR